MSSNLKRLNEIVSVIRKYHLIKHNNPVSMREALEELGPTFIKIGQIMSSRPDLVPEEYCLELKKLRSQVKPMTYGEIIDILNREYDNKTFEIFKSIEEVPIGSASIAQTHKAILIDDTSVVIKIERPNVGLLMEQDIKVLKKAIKILNIDRLFSNIININDFLDEMYSTALEEMDFLVEARHMKEFSIYNKDIKYLKSVKVYDEYSTKYALVMEYIGGCNINDIESLKKNGYDITEISEKLADNYIKQAIDDGYFHADPHSDNIKIENGKIVYLDYGMMGKISLRYRNLLERCLISISNNDYNDVASILKTIDTNSNSNYVDQMHLKNDIKIVLDKNVTSELSDINVKDFAADMFSMLNRHKITLPRDITMLIRGIVVIAGLLEEINPKISLMVVLKNHIDVSKSINKETITKYLVKSAKSGADLMLIPNEALTILRGINSGDLRFNVEMTDSNGQINRMEKLFHLAIITTIDVALLISISLMCRGDNNHPILFNFYILGAILCTGYLIIKLISAKFKRK